MHKTKLALSTTMFGLALATGSLAFAAPHHASQCNPKAPALTIVDYDQWGISNISGSQDATVECGGGVEGGFASTITLSVRVYDRHSTKNVACGFRILNANGDVVAGPKFAGTSGWAPGAKELKATLPNIRGYAHIECDIPPVDPLIGQRSHVATYLIP